MTSPSTGRAQIRNIGIADLRNYRLPIPGVVSILHRASGMLLFLALPLLLWLFERSLSSAEGFARVAGFARALPARLLLVALAWGLLHHLCAGVRFLLLDLHLGVERAAARRSSWIVLAVSLPLALLFALCMFWGA